MGVTRQTILSIEKGNYNPSVTLGTFGPGILRELGWLKDKDEFERRAALRVMVS